MEHHGRGARREAEGPGQRQAPRRIGAGAAGRHPDARRGPFCHRDQRARPRAGRRHRGRLGRADRRRPGHRQVHAGAPDAAAGVGAQGQGALRHGRGIAGADQDARPAAGRQGREPLCACRDVAGRGAACGGRAGAPGPRRRFGPDGLHVRAAVRSGQRGAGARGVGQADDPCQTERAFRPS